MTAHSRLNTRGQQTIFSPYNLLPSVVITYHFLASHKAVVFFHKGIYGNYKIQLQCIQRAIVSMKSQLHALKILNKGKPLKIYVAVERGWNSEEDSVVPRSVM